MKAVVVYLLLTSFILKATEYSTTNMNHLNYSFFNLSTNSQNYEFIDHTNPFTTLYHFYNEDLSPVLNYLPDFQFSYDPFIFNFDSSSLYDPFTLHSNTMNIDSLIGFDSSIFNNKNILKNTEHEYYIPVIKYSSLSDRDGEEVFVSSRDLFDSKNTKNPTQNEKRILTPKLPTQNYVIKKIAKPLKFYYEKKDKGNKNLEPNGFIVKNSATLSYIDISEDGNKYKYTDVYYCETKEKLQQFENGNMDACNFGRISALLTEKNNYFKESKNININCEKENAFAPLEEIKHKLRSKDDELFDEILFSFKEKFSPADWKKLVNNLANKKNVAKGYPHESITPEELIRHVIKVSKLYNIDPRLILAIIEQESAFRPSVIGGVGEIGLMQVTPNTAGIDVAKDLKIKNFNKNLLYDPKTNISVGVHYLSMQIKKFNGDMVAAIAAYNRGAEGARAFYAKHSSYYTKDYVYPSQVINRYKAYKRGSELFLAQR